MNPIGNRCYVVITFLIYFLGLRRTRTGNMTNSFAIVSMNPHLSIYVLSISYSIYFVRTAFSWEAHNIACIVCFQSFPSSTTMFSLQHPHKIVHTFFSQSTYLVFPSFSNSYRVFTLQSSAILTAINT